MSASISLPDRKDFSDVQSVTIGSESEWRTKALKVAIVAGVAFAAMAVIGGLITGFVFAAIYCPKAAVITTAVVVGFIFEILFRLVLK